MCVSSKPAFPNCLSASHGLIPGHLLCFVGYGVIKIVGYCVSLILGTLYELVAGGSMAILAGEWENCGCRRR